MLLTSTRSEQLQADYWIHRLAEPNRVIKTPEERERFNNEIDEMLSDIVNVFKIETTFPGSKIKEQIQLEYDTVSNRMLFDRQGKRVPKEVFTAQVSPILGLDTIPARIALKWGAATRATSVRALPITMKMIEDPTDIEFDQLQFTLIKLWTPVAIYHTSKDGKWYYIQAPYVRGWVMSKDIALFENRDALKKKAKSKSFLVVTGESVPVCVTPACEKGYQRPSMGTVLPLAEKTETHYVVWMPFRSENGNVHHKKGYIKKKSDVREGFPSYTQANVIRQAFKLLGVRYGWGGMYNGRDCSGFVQDVFLSMGIDMPRDSKKQPFAGTVIGSYEPYQGAEKKDAALQAATPGITLLRMPKHMMLYLGEENNHYYVIHSTWAERIGQDPVKDEKKRINQVVVSDLSLNGNSYVGSLFDRIIQISEVD